MIEKYGRVRVRQIVSHFYGAVLKSRRLSHYFDHVDVHGLMAHQSAFLAAVMGGPPSHDEPEIETAHRGLGVDEGDFDEMIRLLELSLERFEVEAGDIEEVTRRYHGYRESVVAAGSANAR